jgi:hypothetical protein
MNRGAKMALAFGGALVAVGAIVLVSTKDAKAAQLPNVKPPLPTDGQPPAHPDQGGVVVVPPHGADEPSGPPVVVPGPATPEGGFDRSGPFAVPGIQDAGDANRILLRWWSAEGAAFPASELPSGTPRDFGSAPEDLSETFGPRSARMALAFCQGNCNTATQKALQTSGTLTNDLMIALHAWANANQLPAAETPIAPSTPAPIIVTNPQTNQPVQIADLPPAVPSSPPFVPPAPAQPQAPALPTSIPSSPPFIPAPAPPAPAPAPAAAQPSSVPADTAALVKALLADEGTATWKRKSPAVQAWQASRGLKQDGEFGPKSAITVAQEVGTVPIVRYWPTGAQQAKAVRDYQSALLSLASSAHEPRASQLRFAAQREQGQGFGSNQKAIPAAQQIHLEVS